jgi:hypothetical protein
MHARPTPQYWQRDRTSVMSITREDAFAVWAPDDVLWSEWAKPIAFVQWDEIADDDMPVPAPQRPFRTAPPLDSVVVVDLPGAESVRAGLALAASGFRPIPLFNGTSGPSPLIDVAAITRALRAGVDSLKQLPLRVDAPPAFLIDSRRGGPSAPSASGYDNRWVVLPQDFPSGSLLRSRGIMHATLLRNGDLSIASDLAHVLRRWQENGIRIHVVDLGSGRVAEDVTVPKPSGFRLAWYAAIALLGLRRNNVGGFGSPIPEATARSGFYG